MVSALFPRRDALIGSAGPQKNRRPPRLRACAASGHYVCSVPEKSGVITVCGFLRLIRRFGLGRIRGFRLGSFLH